MTEDLPPKGVPYGALTSCQPKSAEDRLAAYYCKMVYTGNIRWFQALPEKCKALPYQCREGDRCAVPPK